MCWLSGDWQEQSLLFNINACSLIDDPRQFSVDGFYQSCWKLFVIHQYSLKTEKFSNFIKFPIDVTLPWSYQPFRFQPLRICTLWRCWSSGKSWWFVLEVVLANRQWKLLERDPRQEVDAVGTTNRCVRPVPCQATVNQTLEWSWSLTTIISWVMYVFFRTSVTILDP